jgi:hypothetical protein
VEPISPELVLIDPQLAQVERARLAIAADVRLRSGPVAERPDPQSWRQGWWGLAAQRFVDLLILIAWAGVVIAIVLFIHGLDR